MTEPLTYQESTRVTGKVVVVTGPASGIGAQIALRFAEAGASVVLNADHNAQGLQQVAKRITDLGGKTSSVQADISQPDGAQKLFTAALDKFSRVDGLGNKAGGEAP